MPAAPLPPDELPRLDALRRLNVLDTPAEPAFDDLTRLAATICGTPIALVSLVDADRQWFKSCVGLDATQTPRDVAFCAHAILRTELFVVPDAAADERFAANPLVTGPPHIRFYAGMPLVTPDGHAVGALCAVDRVPRTLSPSQADALRVLARQVVAQLQLRKQMAEQVKEYETFRVLFEQSSDAHLLFDERDGIIDCNHAAVTMLRLTSKEEVLALHPAVLSPEFQPCGRRSMEKCVEMDATARRDGYHRFDWTHRRADGEDFPCEVTLTPVTLHGRSVLLVVWHDLTGRKRAEDSLRASADRQRVQQAALLELIRSDLLGGEEVTGRVLEVVTRTVGVARASVWHLTAGQNGLRCAALYERGADRHSAGMTLSAADFSGYFRALESDEVIAAADAASDPRTCEFRDCYLVPLGITSMLDVPLRLGGRLGGVLCLEHIGRPRAWEADEQLFALGVANIVSLAVEQSARLRAEEAVRASEGRFRLVWEQSAEGMRLTDAAGTVVMANPAYRRLVGRGADEVVGRPFTEAYAADERAVGLAKYRRRFADRAARGQVEAEVVLLDGSRRWFEVADSHLALPGQPPLLLTVFRDVTDRRRAGEGLRASEQRFRGAFDNAPIGVALVGPDGRWLKVNRALCDTLGYTEPELLATDFQTLTHPDDLGTDLDLVRRMLAGELNSYQMEKRYLHKGGATVHAVLAVSLVRAADGRPEYFVSHVKDVTARTRAELELRASEEQLRALGDNLPDGIVYQYVIGPDGRDHFPYVSRGVERLTGRTAAQVRADSGEMFRLVHPDDVQQLAAAIRRSMGELSEFDLELRYSHPNGGVRWMHIRSAPRLLPDGGTAWDGVMMDVTDRKRAEDELRQNQHQLIAYQQELERANVRLHTLATTDRLTGVKNRGAFNDKLGEEFDRAVRHDHPLSVVLLDVDHFKSFNDTFGHPAGDAVLQRVAALLQHTVRGTDTVARYGGEEFAILLPDTDRAGAMVLAERLRRAIAGASWDERPITISVGVSTLAPATAAAAALVQQADQALYRSKQAGRNRVHHGSQAVVTAVAVRT